ncbi:MAG: heavy metal translocating P-type ATPase [Pyrinomonadaceae bacterium]
MAKMTTRRILARLEQASRRPSFSSLETVVALISTLAILLHLILQYLTAAPRHVSSIPLFVTLVIGGLPILFDLIRRLSRRELGTDVLAGVAIITSVILGEYLVGAIIVLMFSGGIALEQYATHRASSVLDALAKRMPRSAHRKLETGIADISLDQVTVGELLSVLPHEYCPVDGVIVEGHGTMDESFLTGEPFEMSKAPGSQVLSGAINGESVLAIRATKLPVDSRYARIMQVMQQAEQNRPQLRRLGDRLGAWYTPVALVVALFGWVLSGDSDRFLAVIVIATPCPLLIAIPVAVIGAISLAARRGIIIKNPAMLEQIDKCRTLVFDKTGTLTYGRPSLTEVICAPGFSKADVLVLAASLEQYSRHPLAQALSKTARQNKFQLRPVTEISERPGEGMRGIVDRRKIEITGRGALIGDGRAKSEDLPPPTTGLECLILIDEVYAAALRFRDEPRDDSSSFVSHLSPRHGVSKVMLLSGDRESEVLYLAGKVGITQVHSGKSPEDKVEIVTEEAKRGPTLFVGDGINDAPAMQAATVGVAFGQNSDITSEAADAVIMDASLRRVDELIHIGRRMRGIALQSAVGGMGLSLIGMFLAAFGYLPPVAGVVAQEVIDVVAVLNALRVTLPVKELADY